MSRMRELLEATQRDLKAERSPLNEAFLQEHVVTYDECMELAELLGSAIRVYLSVTDDALAAIYHGQAVGLTSVQHLVRARARKEVQDGDATAGR